MSLLASKDAGGGRDNACGHARLRTSPARFTPVQYNMKAMLRIRLQRCRRLTQQSAAAEGRSLPGMNMSDTRRSPASVRVLVDTDNS